MKEGIIFPAQSKWASAFLLVPKPDGKVLFCVDCRQLDTRNVKDTCPIPRIDEYIDSLGEASWFKTRHEDL